MGTFRTPRTRALDMGTSPEGFSADGGYFAQGGYPINVPGAMPEQAYREADYQTVEGPEPVKAGFSLEGRK